MGTSRKSRSGQAFVELACGMLALALVLSALFSFSSYIVKSLDLCRGLRADAGRRAMLAEGGGGASASVKDAIDVEPFSGSYIFNSETIAVEETAYIPNMKGLDAWQGPAKIIR